MCNSLLEPILLNYNILRSPESLRLRPRFKRTKFWHEERRSDIQETVFVIKVYTPDNSGKLQRKAANIKEDEQGYFHFRFPAAARMSLKGSFRLSEIENKKRKRFLSSI